MLNLLAQSAADYDYTYTTVNTEVDKAGLAGLAIFSGFMLFVWLVVVVIMVISFWKIFEKADRPGWAAIIPIYNYWVAAEIAGYPGWIALVVLLAFIPFVGWIAAVVVGVLVTLGIVRAFRKEPDWAWTLLCLFIPIVGYPILAFGDDKYHGPKDTKKPTAPAQPAK